MSETGEEMTVTRVHTARESHVEPPLDPDWDEYTQLRWQAAVVAYDTGLRITVNEGGLSVRVGAELVPVPGTYNMQIGRSSHSAFDYDGAWKFLSGVSAAREAANQEAK